MDGDGEDDPTYIPQMLECFEEDPNRIVLAGRHRRSEGPVFSVGYRIYKAIFRILTGQSISFGNYSLIPMSVARTLAYMPNLWNSLPATVLHSKTPATLLKTVRGRRYHGTSHMKFTNLVTHGLFSISVFSETVPIRMALMIGATSLALASAVIVIRLFTEFGIPGWASFMVGLFAIIFIQALFVLLSSSLLTLQNRTVLHVIPAIHGAQYIRAIQQLLPAE